MLQDHIFKGIAIAEQEGLRDKSNRDKSLLMEKLGAIDSAESCGSAAVLRNKLVHVYPEASCPNVKFSFCKIIKFVK